MKSQVPRLGIGIIFGTAALVFMRWIGAVRSAKLLLFASLWFGVGV